MNIGVSLRPEWLPQWEQLALDQFNSYEIVPYFSINRDEIVNELFDKADGKDIYLHLTDASAYDDAEHFKRETEHVIALCDRKNVRGVSLHFGVGVFNGVRFPNIFPVPRSDKAVAIAKSNLSYLSQAAKKPVSIEHLSMTTDMVSPESYFSSYFEVAKECNCGLLLDYSNFWATSKNLGWNNDSVIKECANHRIDYMHFGGSYNLEGTQYDAHHEFNPSQDLKEFAHEFRPAAPVILELDGDLANAEKCRGYFKQFIKTFT